MPEKPGVVGMNLTFPTVPTEWMYFGLSCLKKGNPCFGIASPTVENVGSILSAKIPAILRPDGKLPLLFRVYVTYDQMSFCLASAVFDKYSLLLKYEFYSFPCARFYKILVNSCSG